MNPKQIPIILSVLLAASVASAQWIGTDLGTPAQTGSFTINGDGTTTIKGGGNDIWDSSDKGYFYYQPVSGLNWEVVVRVRSLDGPDTWTKGELMIRVPDSSGLPAANDPFLALMTTRAAGQNEIRDQHRASRGGGAGEIAVSPVVRPSYPNTWLRLQRFGGKVTSYYGTNGVDWVKYSEINTLVSTGDWNGGSRLPYTVLVGFAITGHNDTPPNVGTAIISNMAVTQTPVTPPNTAVVLTNVVNDTAYLGTEATFSFVTTNSGANPVFPGYNVMEYKWYRNATLITNATGPYLTFLSRTEDNGAAFYCVANIEAPNASITVTSATANLTVLPGSLMYTNGVKQEFFAGGTRVATEAGGTAPGAVTVSRTMDLPQNLGNNYSRRISGWFIPDTTTEHVFFLAADDDTDLFLSTDANPANKRIIARETGWAASLAWTGTDEACSSFYTEDAGVTYPYATGILLTAGQPYYIEAVHHQGGGGDNLAVTFKHFTEFDPLPNDPTRMTNGLVLITSPVTTLSWMTQPTNTSSYEGVNAVLAAEASSDSEFLVNYQWYRNNAPIAGANKGTYTVSAPTMTDSGAQFFVTATTALGELSITSAPITLTVLQSVWEPGWASVEFFPGASIASVIAGAAGKPSYVTTTPKFEAGVNGESGEDYARRVSGYFVPPTTDDYVFFVNSDDASELYLSTDNKPANKRLIAQQIDSSGTWQWLDGDNGRSAQKRSDQWSPDSGATVPYQSGIRLTGGQKYYMEVIQREGSGDDHVEVTYKKLTDADPVNGKETRMLGSVIGINAVRCSWVAFTTQPTNATAGLASTAKFVAVGATDSTQSIGVTGDPRPLAANPVYVMYQWQRNGTDIPGATDSTLAVTPVQPADNGAVFVCKMRALGFANNALTPIWSNSQSATLTVTGPSVFEPGFVRVEFWENDASRASIYAGKAGTPTYVTTSPAFTAAVNEDSGANFGRRLSGYFIPPATDNYVFFMASDDDGDLFLSTDEKSTNKRLIARESGASGGSRNWLDVADRRSDQFTDPATGLQPYTAGIPLVGGNKYYIEGVHHEGGGGDYFNVYYKRFNDPDPVNGDDSTMVGAVIGTYVTPSSRVNFTVQPESVVVPTVSTVTFSALAETDSTLSVGVTGDPRPRVTNPVYTLYQWQRNGVDIPGATEATYSRLIQPSDNTAQFVCKARGLGYANASLAPIWSNSLPATVTFTDTQAPTILYAAYFMDLNVEPDAPIVTIKFSEYMNPTLLSDSARYSITGVTVASAIVNSNDFRSVRLVLSGAPTLPVNVVINGLADPAGNPVAGTSSAIQAVPLISQDIGNLQNNGQPNPVYPSVLWVDGLRDYTVAVQGSDIWGTADGLNFLYEQKTGDFDVVVRQKSIDHTSHWAKGGLMVREALTPGSRHWNVLNTPVESDGIQAVDGSGMGASVVQCGKRDTTDGESAEWSLTLADPPDPAYPNAWLRLKRTGNLLQAYSSIDGVTWLLRGEQDPSTVGALTPLPAQVYVGIASTGHANDDLYSVDPPRFWNFMEFADYNSSFVPTLPTKVAARIVGANVEISWSPAGGRLESCPALGANPAWTDAGTANPAVLPATGTRFFRVVR